jgi:hypothetical protein
MVQKLALVVIVQIPTTQVLKMGAKNLTCVVVAMEIILFLREKILQLSVPFYHLIGSWLYVESFSSRSSQVFKMDGKFFIFFCRLWK